MTTRFLLSVFFLSFVTGPLYAQEVDKVEPPFWWADMVSTELQLLVYGKNIKELSVTSESSSINIIKVHKTDSPNYLFVDIDATKTLPGYYNLVFSDGAKVIHKLSYEFKKRKAGSANRQGIDASDAVYLITPDRFANGDTSNDEVAGMKEGLQRGKEYGRHGGDIQGISDHLDYIQNMGFTAIWLNPILTNDQQKWSYHGYSTTDYYGVDPRFGTNESYVQLSERAEDMGVGMIMDIIVNHCGSEHRWMKDAPFDDWINQPSTDYLQTNHRKETLLDPYASAIDRKTMVEGWFVPTMPDLNQRNPFMSTYLIQNSIWWIEYAHLSAIRQDTYSYPFKEFMSDWTCAIMTEYPNFYIVGEEWIDDTAVISYWQQGKMNVDENQSCLPGLMDFPLCFSISKALVNDESWDTGLIELYKSLSKDYHYPDPAQLVIFTDNHDMKRTYVQLGEDLAKFKMAMIFLMTTRGIPQLYYGTEILMATGKDGSHGYIRSDFPGGWPADSISVKDRIGLTSEQQNGQSFCKRLLQWRKNQTTIHKGKLMHFVPENGFYVYFRYDETNTVMVILNKNEGTQELNLSRFQERLDGYSKGIDILSGRQYEFSDALRLEGGQGYILELD